MTQGRDQSQGAALRQELAELIEANEKATGWGAAVGARSERIKAIEGLLRRTPEITPAAKTPVSSPQSGEGELLREALEDAAQCSWCGLWCSKYAPEPPIHDAVWKRLEKLAVEQPGRMVRWDDVIAALTTQGLT